MGAPGIWEKSQYGRGHAFEKLISLELNDRLTSGLLSSMSPLKKKILFDGHRYPPVPVTGHGMWHVHMP